MILISNYGKEVKNRRSLLSMASIALASTLALSACGPASNAPGTMSNGAAPSASSPAASSTISYMASQKLKETSKVSPRVVLAYDGGLMTIDSSTGEVVNKVRHEGFLRLNNAGDGRHIFVTDGDQFRLFDAGITAEKHGDHHHYFFGTPKLSDAKFPAEKAGHVVVHDGATTLFADGTGEIKSFNPLKLASGEVPTLDAKTESAHHGVAVLLKNGNLLTTQGTTESRSAVQVLDGSKVVAETTDCPGVHGEAAAQSNDKGDVIVVGCENGPVIYKDGAFHKVETDFDYARTGNAAGSDHSDVVLMDLKTDKNAEHERPTQVALVNTTTGKLSTVKLDSSNWFRSLARGTEGEALVLTFDGDVVVIDEVTGKITHQIPAISPWTEREEWQEAGPILKTAGSKAYVTDATKKELKIIDLKAMKVERTVKLDKAAVEMAVVTGTPESSHADH